MSKISAFGSLDRSVYRGATREDFEIERREAQRLAAESRTKICADKGDTATLQAETRKLAHYSAHAKEITSLLAHPENGNVYQRHKKRFEKGALVLAVGSEIATIPLLVMNIWAMCRKKTQPFITESVDKKRSNVNPLIAQNPVVIPTTLGSVAV